MYLLHKLGLESGYNPPPPTGYSEDDDESEEIVEAETESGIAGWHLGVPSWYILFLHTMILEVAGIELLYF